EWAAWANGVAVRELDFHDTFLAAEYSHPGDNIPPILAVAQHKCIDGKDLLNGVATCSEIQVYLVMGLCRPEHKIDHVAQLGLTAAYTHPGDNNPPNLAVAQHKGIDGKDRINGVATGYEIQVDLVKGMCLHEHKIDHVAHLGPSAAAGIGAMLGLPTEVTFQAVQQALHVTTATRQSRKGEISSWKAHAPAFAGKMAVEAVDRARRGEGAPNPIYEGEDGFIAWILSGPEARYTIPLPGKGEAKRAILDTYTKEHSAEYQAQALIDLARK